MHNSCISHVRNVLLFSNMILRKKKKKKPLKKKTGKMRYIVIEIFFFYHLFLVNYMSDNKIMITYLTYTYTDRISSSHVQMGFH